VFLLDLAPWLLATLFLVGAIAIGIIPFFLIRSRWHGETPQDSRELGAQVALRVSVLYSVILGMVFAEVQNSYSDIKRTIHQETIELGTAFAHLELLDNPGARDAQRGLVDYARRVVDTEWPLMGRKQPNVGVTALLAEIQLMIAALPGDDVRSNTLRQGALHGINEVARLHATRMLSSIDEVPYLFWIVVVFGFGVIVALFMVFKPTLLNLALVSAFCAMTGVVLFFIFVMSNPFLGPAKISSEPFEFFIEGAESHIAAEGAQTEQRSATPGPSN
jgi:hypothetical protein